MKPSSPGPENDKKILNPNISTEIIIVTMSKGEENKLAKARKMRKLPGTLGLKKFRPGRIWVENVWTQNTCILAFLHTFIRISGNPTKTQNFI